MATQVSMSGPFSADNVLLPKLSDTHAGTKPHIFQPPRTPSASTSLHRSTNFIAGGQRSGTASRKRTRQEYYASDQSESESYGPNIWSPMESVSSALISPGAMSPEPFVNSQYKLAGGLDTPTAAFASALERSDTYATLPDLTLRWGRGWDRSSGVNSDSYFPQASPILRREANGRARLHASQPGRPGWGEAVYKVAGRVWEFCTMNAFRGFYAGGGQGYRMPAKSQLVSCEQSVWKELEKTEEYFKNREINTLPGRFPDEDFIPDYMSQNHITPPRAAKKIQREKGEGDLRASWVMVGSTSTSRESSPTRISARKMPPICSPSRRPMSRTVRRPILPASRPSTSYAGSPGLRPDRPTSFASSRSPNTTPKHESPLNLEVQRHAARMRKRELEDDAHLKRFNQQLEAMIKEGKEALGTRFEIGFETDGMIDEGYAEGEYFDEEVKDG